MGVGVKCTDYYDNNNILNDTEDKASILYYL